MPINSASLPTIRTQSSTIALRWLGSDRGPEAGVKALQRAAMEWSYVVRNRHRWSGREALVTDQAAKAEDLLKRFNVSDSQLRDLTRGGVAQVVVPYESEEVGWEGRVLPWEFVITAATRTIRHGEPLAIIRQLAPSPPRSPSTRRAPKSVLYVESAPGPLGKDFSFDSERALVQTNLGSQFIRWHEIKNPTRGQLADKVARVHPDIIHLAGFDTHQGMRLASIATKEQRARGDADPSTDDGADQRLRDGYVLAGDKTIFDPIGADELARVLCNPYKPLLVSCSVWNSASRICSALVAEGAAAAIGFQDSFDDDLVELFFSTFYRRWRDAAWTLSDGFLEAWEKVRQHPAGLVGTGIVLWSDRPLVGPDAQKAPRELATGKRSRLTRERLARTRLDPEQERFEEVVTLEVKPFEELNYSLLHNKRPLFDTFKLIKKKAGIMTDVAVTADLNAGGLSFPYRKLYDFPGEKGETLDLAREIHTALTADLARSVRESVNTSLFVEVLWQGHVLYRDTHRVRLLPADQWRDTDVDRVWLPCFVLPRDPAVEAIIAKAQRYVRVLRDDPTAGFDGYQSVDPDRDDPTEDVDLQVQAIWSAITHEWQLGYVNPPPSYSKGLDSQRLRTPTSIVNDKCGTCIDLTLLMTACLELVDIYPVVFLLEGHAFPGYWRSEQFHEDFLKVRKAPRRVPADPRGTLAAGTAAERWVSGRVAYDEIVEQIDRGHLVPIESVMLTENSGFWGAVEAGKENLHPRKEFNSMLDIVSAREVCVTPLPITEPHL